MRTLLSMLTGILIGCFVTMGYVVLSGGWYEHHLHERGDPPPAEMVNQRGWELVTVEETAGAAVWLYRRPRFRLH